LIASEVVISSAAMELVAPLLADELVVGIIASDGVGLVVADKGVVQSECSLTAHIVASFSLAAVERQRR
jgi:hypothetical protein